jgi:hypothetical protein
MLQLRNETPFKAALGKFPNAAGVDTIYLVTTATFQMSPHLELAEEQLPPVLSDEYHGEPGASSLRYAGELHPGKPTTDVILLGHARAPGGKQVTELKVGLRVGPREKVLQVIGDRHWLGLEPSKPAPFVVMPLVYERAFGGNLRMRDAVIQTEERNPVGVGFALGIGRAANRDPLPNIEDPRQLLTEGTRPSPAGFGCVAPSWLPRRSFAGTYDERWQQTRAPYLPEDFQAQYLNCASEGLTFDRHLMGGEPVLLVGMSERGPLRSAIPACALETRFSLRGQQHVAPNHLQTVLIEPDENRLRLTYHAEFACDKVALEVERVEVRLGSLDLTVPRP